MPNILSKSDKNIDIVQFRFLLMSLSADKSIKGSRSYSLLCADTEHKTRDIYLQV